MHVPAGQTFITEPHDVYTMIGGSVFFPCSSNFQNQPSWIINGIRYSPSELHRLDKHFYNGTGLIVSNVNASMNMWTYACFFTLVTSDFQIHDVQSTTGVLWLLLHTGLFTVYYCNN